MNLHLLLYNIFYIFDLLLLVFLSLFVFFKTKRDTATITLILLFAGCMVFVISQMIGPNVSDGELSRQVLMFNLVDIFLPIFGAHCVFAFLKKQKEQKVSMSLFYVVGLGLMAFFIINPKLFLVTSVPKLYFPNYYEPGPYYWIMLLFFFSVLLYLFYWMWRAYLVSSGVDKNRIKYFFIGLILGYLSGSTDFLLIYNIPADPLWGFLFVPLFAIPFTYAALRYELMDIQLVAKKAFIYALVAGVLGTLLVFLNYVNTLIIESSPDFPSWVFSAILAIIATVAIMLIWRKIREADMLKYEFINVVTHKFRTPLTSIKWSGENLIEAVPDNLKVDVRHIQNATEHLVELTNLLVNLSGTDDKSYEYVFNKVDLGEILTGCAEKHIDQAKAKGITLTYNRQSGFPISADAQRIKFVIQTLIDNAISYTPQGGTITVNILFSGGRTAVISVADTGIGISKNDLKYIFTKFYRAENGRKTDTEGMGIGLYLAQRIIERHGGKLWVESEGEGKGSTFYINLPMVNG